MALIAVLDYGIGNLRSAQKALERVGADARLTDDHALIRDAAGVVLPGVGAFGPCMAALEARGLDDLAIEAAYSGRPFLGVCVGMQLLFQGSEESPDVPGLGVLPGVVRRLPDGVKRPQMQWNVLRRTDGSEGGGKGTKSGKASKGRRESRLLAGMAEPSWVYFVHSYAAAPDEHTVATCDYPEPLSAAVERDALWATQFHPEKSSMAGLKILANFVRQADDAAKAA